MKHAHDDIVVHGLRLAFIVGPNGWLMPWVMLSATHSRRSDWLRNISTGRRRHDRLHRK